MSDVKRQIIDKHKNTVTKKRNYCLNLSVKTANYPKCEIII